LVANWSCADSRVFGAVVEGGGVLVAHTRPVRGPKIADGRREGAVGDGEGAVGDGESAVGDCEGAVGDCESTVGD
jgi:hypothetical protein